MERLRSLLRQREFHVLLFFLSAILVSWPFVTFSDVERLKVMFKYLFLTWGVIILLLFLVSRSLVDSSDSEETEEEKQ
jgi:hypothetical protein